MPALISKFAFRLSNLDVHGLPTFEFDSSTSRLLTIEQPDWTLQVPPFYSNCILPIFPFPLSTSAWLSSCRHTMGVFRPFVGCLQQTAARIRVATRRDLETWNLST